MEQERDQKTSLQLPMSDLTESSISVRRARALLGDARGVLVLTGAGVSQPSGVPTFRGVGGLWRDYRPEELATAEAFASDPRLVWEWYAWRRERIAHCEPNAAHHALARFAAVHPDVSIVTQNVDGLHEGAAAALAATLGAESALRARPLALHGSLHRVRCTRCPHIADHHPEVDATSLATLPRCPRCNALLRPGVVWFGEALSADLLSQAWRAAEAADVCLVVGTSAMVQPAASLAAATQGAGGQVIEVNPHETPLSPLASVVLRDSASAIVPAILAAWQSADQSSRPAPGRQPGRHGHGPDGVAPGSRRR